MGLECPTDAGGRVALLSPLDRACVVGPAELASSAFVRGPVRSDVSGAATPSTEGHVQRERVLPG